MNQAPPEQLTAAPAPFPAPVISQAAVSRQIVLVHGPDGGTLQIEATVLANTASHNFFEITRVIRGSIFGQVHHGVRVVQHESFSQAFRRAEPIEEVAIKVYNRAKLRELAHTTHENPLVEIACLQFLGANGGHPNVVKQLECSMDDENVFSVMEFIDGGELYDLVEQLQQRNPPVTLDEPTARSYFVQIVQGLSYVHSFGVGHRDLSLENILIEARTGVCKVIDMGMCLRMSAAPAAAVAAAAAVAGSVLTFDGPLTRDDGDEQPLVYLLIPPQGTCGKRNYIAPEIIQNSHPFSPCKVDAWSLGVVLFLLLCGTPPVDIASNLDQRYQMVANGELRVLLETWQLGHISSNAVDLMERLLKVNPDERIRMDDILTHPWVQNC